MIELCKKCFSVVAIDALLVAIAGFAPSPSENAINLFQPANRPLYESIRDRSVYDYNVMRAPAGSTPDEAARDSDPAAVSNGTENTRRSTDSNRSASEANPQPPAHNW